MAGRQSIPLVLGLLLFVLVVSLACSQNTTHLPTPASADLNLPQTALARGTAGGLPGNTPAPGVQTAPVGPQYTPTPDAPHPLPTPRTLEEEYTIQTGDSLSSIARIYGISMQALALANQIDNPDLIAPGQVLIIPTPIPGDFVSGVKILPDSEFVNGPGSVGFNGIQYARSAGGYLASYQEVVDGSLASGPEILQRVASEFSVSPRLLLAVLEYRSGWVTQSSPDPKIKDYPISRMESWRKGLYLQLAWTANQLNYGYYRWRVNGVNHWILADGSAVFASPVINSGTAGIQHFFAMLDNRQQWNRDVSEQGFSAVYQRLFGFPFARAVDPLVPPGLQQIEMQLPFEPGVVWSFTGGPHGGWADGSAWAALDFAPPGAELGCAQSDAWETAVASGTVAHTGIGIVMLDLDTAGPGSNDGLVQTGWVVLYMHVASRDRVTVGTHLEAGDRIGHPSCEGGFSQATHLHLARLYNGEWIPADQNLPFNLDGWKSLGTGQEYDGFLVKDGVEIEAWNAYREESTLSR